jgi:DNA-binding MarR family transcriptional regulator
MIYVRYNPPMSSRQRKHATPTPLAERGAFLLSQLGYHVAIRANELLAPLGLRTPHYGILMHLSTEEGQTQQQLADSLGVHRNAMVSLIDELEGRELVRRERDTRDRRAHHIHLTDGARALLADADTVVDGLEHEIFAEFSDEERARLVALLRRAAGRANLRAGIHPGLRRQRSTSTTA